MSSIREQLIQLLHEKTIQGIKKNNSYTCIHAGYKCIIFDSNKTSKKVMIPMDIAVEWVQALIDSKIYIEYTSRLKRNTITQDTLWSTTNHSFESHLNAILRTYNEKYLS